MLRTLSAVFHKKNFEAYFHIKITINIILTKPYNTTCMLHVLQDCFVSDEIVFYIYMSSMMIITFSFLLSLQQYLYNCAKFSGPKSA